jgi:FkbM family methyltransferase
VRVVHDWRWSFRLLPTALQELRIRPLGVLHIGAHRGEEVPLYLECGFDAITLVEPDPENCAVIASQPWIDDRRVGIVNCAAGAVEGRETFHRAEVTPFSGLQQDDRQTPAGAFPVHVLPTSTIQQQQPANVLVVDTQGTEMDVLASVYLAPLDLIIVEAQTERRGSPGAYWPDLISWCRSRGWAPAVQWKRDDRWSDVLLTPRRLTDPEPTA